jgi:hypothetical protein
MTGGQGTTTDPAAVATALIAAENAGDVEGAVSLFHPDAVVNDANGQRVGVDAIREWQVGLAANHFNADIQPPQVSGQTATFDGSMTFDAFRNLGLDTLDATWVLEVEDGKVRTFTFRFTPESGARLHEALQQAGSG